MRAVSLRGRSVLEQAPARVCAGGIFVGPVVQSARFGGLKRRNPVQISETHRRCHS